MIDFRRVVTHGVTRREHEAASWVLVTFCFFTWVLVTWRGSSCEVVKLYVYDLYAFGVCVLYENYTFIGMLQIIVDISR